MILSKNARWIRTNFFSSYEKLAFCLYRMLYRISTTIIIERMLTYQRKWIISKNIVNINIGPIKNILRHEMYKIVILLLQIWVGEVEEYIWKTFLNNKTA